MLLLFGVSKWEGELTRSPNIWSSRRKANGGCTHWEEQQIQKAPSFPSSFHVFLKVESLTRSNVHCMTHLRGSETVDSSPFGLCLHPNWNANAIQVQTETVPEERAATFWNWEDYSLQKISGLDGRTDVHAACSDGRAGGLWRGASRRRSVTTPEWCTPSSLRADLVSTCDAPCERQTSDE